jgi:hypothetical protein
MTSDAARDSLSELASGGPGRLPEADADALAALLGDLGAWRLSLSADMGSLASAVELQATGVVDQVVDGARADLAAFAERAQRRAGQGLPQSADRLGDGAPVLPLRRRAGVARAGGRAAISG